jgi:hypothetical protein
MERCVFLAALVGGCRGNKSNVGDFTRGGSATLECCCDPSLLTIEAASEFIPPTDPVGVGTTNVVFSTAGSGKFNRGKYDGGLAFVFDVDDLLK